MSYAHPAGARRAGQGEPPFPTRGAPRSFSHAMPFLRVPEIVYTATTVPPEIDRAWTEQPGSQGLEWTCVDVVAGLDADGFVSAVSANALAAQVVSTAVKETFRVSPSGSPVQLRYYQKEAVEAVFRCWEEGKNAPIIICPTGCHRAGQRVLMFDGSTKAVESVQVDDVLRGPRGQQRSVLALCRGQAPMWTIRPTSHDGWPSWVVNGDHVLALQYFPDSGSRRKQGPVAVSMRVADYIMLPFEDTERFLLYREHLSTAMGGYYSYEFSRFEVTPTDAVEPFYGFVLDGDHLYLLADGTITHNSGKTLVAAEVMRIAHESCLYMRPVFIAHRQELLDQTLAKVKLMAPTRTVGLVQAERNEPDRQITVASVQTLAGKNGERIKQIIGDHPPQLLVIDESHHAVANSYGRVIEAFRAANPNIKILGLSVGPDSYVELRGGPFSTGFVGRIEDAWTKAAQSISSRTAHGFNIMDLRDVQARGWTGKGFAWKDCRRLLRHLLNDEPCSAATVGGRITTVLTDNHAVYVATGRRRSNAGHAPLISTSEASALSGAVLVGDDGAKWESDSTINTWDMLAFASVHMGDYRVYVTCDVKSIPRAALRAAKLTPQAIYDARAAASLPLTVYRGLGRIAPSALALGVAGSSYLSPSTLATEAVAFVLGVWLGDGWIDWERERRDGRGRIGFAIANHQVEDFCAAVRQTPLACGVSFSQRNEGSTEVRVSNVFFGALCRHYFGRVTASFKRIPSEWIVSWSEPARRELLRGLLFSDGHTHDADRGRVRRYYRTTSWGLAHDVLALLRSLRIAGSLGRQPPRDGGVIAGRLILGRHMSYVVHWSVSAEHGDNEGHRGARERFDHSTMKFHERPVRDVATVADRPTHVFDMEMDGHPSFVVNGVLVHNTATPGRADGTSLDRVFDCVAYQKSVYEMINEGYLVPPTGVRVVLDINLDVVDSESGDFVTKKLAKIIDRPAVNDEVVKAWLTHSQFRRTIAFCITKEHAANIAAGITTAGYTAVVVHEKTTRAERKDIYQKFRDGHIKVICSVEVLTEGFDEPSVECILMARPTQSQGLFSQCLGRGLRLFPGKEDCIVVDCTGNSSKYPLAQLANLSGLEPPRPPGEGPPKPPEEEGEEGEARVDGVFAHAIDFKLRKREAKYAWREIPPFGWTLQIPRIGYFLLAWHGQDKTLATVRFHDMRPGRRDSPPITILDTPIEFEMAYGLVESEVQRLVEAKSSRARANDPLQKDNAPEPFAFLEDGLEDDVTVSEATLVNDAGWRLKPTTEKQREFLRKLGLKGEMPETSGEAADLITVMQIERDVKMREPATHKQLWYLRSNHIAFGLTITKNAAKKLILTHRMGGKS